MPEPAAAQQGVLPAPGAPRELELAPLVELGDTLHSWSTETAAMWRFTRNDSNTEGFHNKMELITRQAYGFCNFQNYRLQVRVLCG